jgi:hypothetical protein
MTPISSGLLDEFREETADRLGGLEEPEGSPVSETAGAPPAPNSKTADYLATETERLTGSTQFHHTAHAGLKRRGVFDEKP